MKNRSRLYFKYKKVNKLFHTCQLITSGIILSELMIKQNIEVAPSKQPTVLLDKLSKLLGA